VHQIENRPNLIRPERYRNEIIGFLRDPLQDLSISRPRKRLQWGIPLPFDDNYVTYVWFDALINYVSALGGPGDPRFDRYWPHAQHLIGKDILKPHAVYWPCMLHAAGIEVFRHLHVHGYWMISGRKISKSVGNLVEALALSEKYGNDVFRYFVLREMVFGLDAEFSEEALVGRLNADLANDLGNLVSRVTTLLVNLRDGIVPKRAPHPGIQTVVSSIIGNIDEGLHDRGLGFDRGLSQIWTLVRTLNQEVDGQQPWALAKDPTQQERLDEVLYALAEAVRILGVLLSPFVPDAAAKIRAALDQAGEPRDGDMRWGGLAPGTRVQKLSGLFPRIREDAEAEASEGPPTARQPTRRRGDAAGGGANAAENERISIDDFGRVELRVAEVIAAEAVAKSKKLLKLTVSLGQETRTVLAGIAEHYGPADLVGKKVVVVANLKPAKLMGIESDGMVLAGSSDGELAVVTVDHDLPAGARVK
jgi:methionyl-tRNA synthetase